MASYNLLIKKGAEKEFLSLPKKDKERLIMKIRQLTINPRPAGAEKLKGEDDWRIRQGDYRAVYTIDDDSKTVMIQKVGHRREIYR